MLPTTERFLAPVCLSTLPFDRRSPVVQTGRRMTVDCVVSVPLIGRLFAHGKSPSAADAECRLAMAAFVWFVSKARHASWQFPLFRAK